MAEFPALPIFTDALLGDTTHLSQAEFGAYMLMLIVAWRSPDCALPDDDAYLARITRSVQNRNWARIKPAVMPFWTLGADGHHRQKRLTWERLRSLENAANARKAGKASALKRHQTRATAVAATLQPNANGSPNETPSPLSLGLGKEVSSPPVAPQKPDPKGSRLAPDWRPSAEARSLAASLGIDVDRSLADFLDYWIAKPGAAGRKLDWNRTWAKWCRKAADDRAADRGLGPIRRNPASIAEAAADVAEAFARRGEQAEPAGENHAGGGEVLEPDDEQSPRSSRSEIDDRRPFRGASPIPIRRGEGITSGLEPTREMVADAGGTSGGMSVASGSQAQSPGGDARLDLPGFLKRKPA